MPLKPQSRFLLRGSLLVAAMLALWWFFLLNPMLALLQGAADPFLAIEETPSGDWSLSVALNRILPATPERPVAQQMRSIDFDMQRTDVIAFTFSLPVFWALMLAAPAFGRNLRSLLLGTGIMAAIELAMFLAYTQIAARTAFAHVAGIDDATAMWARHLGEYLIISVLPFILPFAVAFSLQHELRTAMFPWWQAAVTPADLPMPERLQGKRAKK